MKFGGGKVYPRRHGAIPKPTRALAALVHTVITNAVILDHWGIVKADVGLEGRAHPTPSARPAIPTSSGPATIIVGPGTEVIAGEGKILTAGGFDTHIHFICPQQIEEA